MTIDEMRIMAMTPKQAQRERAKLEKKNALNRKKSEEKGMNAEKITGIEENEKSVQSKNFS